MGTEGRIGGRLKLAIQRRGLSNRQALVKFKEAEVPGSSMGNFYKILSNENSPRAAFIIGVSRVLGVAGGWLLTGEGEMDTQEPFSPDDVERLGLVDLPELIQNDVLGLAEQLNIGSDRSGLTLEQREQYIDALSQGIAAWLRIPLLHSDKFRRPTSDLEAIVFCDAALRALRFLIPEPGTTPAGFDIALLILSAQERKLARRRKPRRSEPKKPEIPATVRVTIDG